MEIYTIQLSKRRQLPDTIELIDATVKTGDRRLAPTWDMVFGVKEFKRRLEEANGDVSALADIHGLVTIAEFEERYYNIITQSIIDNKHFWKSLLKKTKIAIGCYCNLTKEECPFCHRLLLKDRIIDLCTKNNIPVVDRGEFEIN